MRAPLWFETLWLISVIANGCACAFVWRNLRRRYPALLFLCLSEVLFYAAAKGSSAHAYFTLYWSTATILAACRLWLAWDVFRDLPSSRWLPSRFRVEAACGLFIAAIALAWATVPRGHYPLITLALRAQRCVLFTWAGCAIFLIAFFAVHGLGHTLTGVRIVTSQLIRITAAAGLILVATSNPTRLLLLTSNSVDTAIGALTAIYIAYTAWLASAVELRRQQDWQNPTSHLNLNTIPLETEGQ